MEDPTPTVICEPESGSIFPLGDTIVSCTAIDADGNIAACTFMVSVVDTTPPDILCPTNRVVLTSNPNGRVIHYNLLVLEDLVDLDPEDICTPPSGSFFPIGSTVVNCTGVDDAGNTSHCSFIVTIRFTPADTPPEIECPDNLLVEATGPDGAIVDYPVPAVSDVEDPSPVVICDPESGSIFRSVIPSSGCTAIDSNGNIAECSFVVSVVDTTPPGWFVRMTWRL